MSSDVRSSLEPFDSLAGRVKLQRQSDKRPIIVTEGQIDSRFLNHLFSGKEVKVFVAGNRFLALEAIREISELNLERVACVVDRDFDGVVAEYEETGIPVAAYDNADLEAMIWNSPALESVLREYGMADRLRDFGGVVTLRQLAAETLIPVERLRYANANGGLGINFDAVPLDRKIDKDSLALKLRPLCSALANNELELTETLYEIATNGESGVCPITSESLFRGKDLLAFASVSLRRRIGNRGLQEVTPEKLGISARLSTGEATLRTSRWMTKVLELLDL